MEAGASEKVDRNGCQRLLVRAPLVPGSLEGNLGICVVVQ